MLYYIRPQEWAGFLSGLHPVTLIMVFALVAMVMKEREFSVKDFFQTPHDWVMFAWFFYTVLTSPTPRETFGEVKSYLIFYLVIVQALSTFKRIDQFLKWWIVMIMLLVGLGLGSKYGFDPLGSRDLTELLKNRLSVNLSIFANPNALGHNVVPVIPLLYFMFAWHRPIFMKQAAVLAMAVPVWCVYLTVSKGAFLSGFGTTVLSMAFGRPKIIQVFILWAAVTIGWTALHQLPRMESMGRLGADKGVQGRLMQFKYGYSIFKTEKFGVGYGHWFKAQYSRLGFYYAAHSAYVMVGGELGFYGLMLYLGLSYCGLRTLVTVKHLDIEEERVRRMLFVLIVSYLISAWMLSLEYRPTYFMTAATVAAFHRYLIGKSKQQSITTPTEMNIVPELAPATAEAGVPGGAAGEAPKVSVAGQVLPPLHPGGAKRPAQGEVESSFLPHIQWNRLGWIDLAIMYAMTKGVERYWGYICRNL